MEILTAPEKLSFYQQEEIDLVESVDAALHQREYFWLQNSYASVQTLPTKYFVDRKDKISKTLRRDTEERLAKVKSDKVAAQKKFGLSDDIMRIAEGVAYCIVWQDDRKAFILRALHYKDVLLNEIVRRSKIDKDGLLDFSYTEILELWDGKRSLSEITERRKGFGQIITNFIDALDTEQTKKYWDIYAEENMVQGLREVRGIVASKGENIRGRVKILLNPREADSFPDGAILVAPMTSPEYIFAMRKSSAVVTDNGGLTSHAAIVSRELHKPCVIGTKIATKVIKDGDMVEVNADIGIVKILK